MLLIGPIIGLVTESSVRILFECNNELPTFVSLYPTHAPSQTFTQRGPTVAMFTGLNPDTIYDVIITHEGNSVSGSFTTSISFISVFSCNNMYKGNTSTWSHLNKKKPDMCIHIGDQVYMDYGGNTFGKAMNHKDYDDMVECFRDAYRTCWSQAHMREILSSCSNVMLWDDHDVYNSWDQHITLPRNWNAIVEQQGWNVLASLFVSRRSRAIIAGMQAYTEYQLSLSGIGYPRSFTITVAGKRLLLIDMRIAKASHTSILDDVGNGYADIIVTGVPVFFLPSLLLNRATAKICASRGLTDVYDQSNLSRSYMRDITTLLAASPNCVLISGDSHMCGKSEIRMKGNSYTQWVTSGISTTLPPKILWLLLLLFRTHLRFINDIVTVSHTYWHRGNGYLTLKIDTDLWRDSIHHIIPSLML